MYYRTRIDKLFFRINVILLLWVIMSITAVSVKCYGLETSQQREQEEMVMPLFIVNDAEFIDVMKYLAYSAVPVGNNVYFNVRENKGKVLYEIGLTNRVNFVANPQPTGITVSISRTNISVRAASQLVAKSCGMEYSCTNGVIQLQSQMIMSCPN